VKKNRNKNVENRKTEEDSRLETDIAACRSFASAGGRVRDVIRQGVEVRWACR